MKTTTPTFTKDSEWNQRQKINETLLRHPRDEFRPCHLCRRWVSWCDALNTEALGGWVSTSVTAKQSPRPLGASTRSLRCHHINPIPAAITLSWASSRPPASAPPELVWACLSLPTSQEPYWAILQTAAQLRPCPWHPFFLTHPVIPAPHGYTGIPSLRQGRVWGGCIQVLFVCRWLETQMHTHMETTLWTVFGSGDKSQKSLWLRAEPCTAGPGLENTQPWDGGWRMRKKLWVPLCPQNVCDHPSLQNLWVWPASERGSLRL